jgi:hypothetical protein
LKTAQAKGGDDRRQHDKEALTEPVKYPVSSTQSTQNEGSGLPYALAFFNRVIAYLGIRHVLNPFPQVSSRPVVHYIEQSGSSLPY